MRTVLGTPQVSTDIQDVPAGLIVNLKTTDNGKNWWLQPPQPLRTPTITPQILHVPRALGGHTPSLAAGRFPLGAGHLVQEPLLPVCN